MQFIPPVPHMDFVVAVTCVSAVDISAAIRTQHPVPALFARRPPCLNPVGGIAMPTIFSKIAAGEIPSHKIWEDERHFAFLDINPWCLGHTLVIPKAEHDYLFDMPEGEYAALHAAAREVARLLKDRLGCARVCSMVVGYEVPHVHIHLFPTIAMSDFLPARAMSMDPKPDLAELAARITGRDA
jgi:histidine triad (HIT) family protein